MAKRFVCKPAPEIEIEVQEGYIVRLRFDLLSVTELQSMEGGFEELLNKPLPELAADIIYAAAKNNNDNFTHDEARMIVSNMSVEDIREIISEYSSAMGAEKNAEQKELSKNLMAQYLSRISK